MFSLIITIISIALVVALVAATMYHGGDVLSEGRQEADAAAFVAGAQQITGAAAMRLALDSADTTVLADLVTNNYLSSIPSVEGSWTSIGGGNLVADVDSAEVCAVLEAKGGETYGCETTGTGATAVSTFTFKY